IRIQNIVSELNGEKIDVVTWDPDAATFIANALSPAQVLGVELDDSEGVAVAVVPDKQLSLAIGKEGQNVRLAVKLSGWRIDIKSASEAEAEKAAEAKLLAEAEEEPVTGEKISVGAPATVESVLVATEGEEAEPSPVLDTTSIAPPASFEIQPVEKVKVRFAEDVLVSQPSKPEAKSKKKKKGVPGKDVAEDGIKLKKRRRGLEVPVGEEEFEEY
ncbi:unnamed protein product, partial [marine sediment metagenome]